MKPLPPVMKEKCKTCPFRKGGLMEHTRLAVILAHSALTEGSRICHSTGRNNLFHKRTNKPERVCRGARDIQLTVMHALKAIDAPTDEAWEALGRKLKIQTP